MRGAQSGRDEIFIADRSERESASPFMGGMISLLKELWSNLLHPDYEYFAATRLTKCRSFAFVVLTIVGVIITHSETAQAACSGGPCVGAGPRLASVNSSRSVLLNALLGDLLGTSLNLTVADWNSIAQGDVSLASYLNALQTQVGVSSPSQALSANATLAQLVSAMAVAAQAAGNTALVNALNSLKPQVAGLSGTIEQQSVEHRAGVDDDRVRHVERGTLIVATDQLNGMD